MADVPVPSIDVVAPTPTSTVLGVAPGGVVKNLEAGPSFGQLSATDGATILGTPEGTVQDALDGRVKGVDVAAPDWTANVGFSAEVSTVDFPAINVLRDAIIVDRFYKPGEDAGDITPAFARALAAANATDYVQAGRVGRIQLRSHDYELTAPAVIESNDIEVSSIGGKLIPTIAGVRGLTATGRKGLRLYGLSVVGLGAQTAQEVDEHLIELIDCEDVHILGTSGSECRGQGAVRLLHCRDVVMERLSVRGVSYAGVQILGACRRVHLLYSVVRDGRGVLTGQASGYGIHISPVQIEGVYQYPEDIFVIENDIADFVEWDGINSHGGRNQHVLRNRITNCRNLIEMAAFNAPGAYLEDVFIRDNVGTCAAVVTTETALSAGISVASALSGYLCKNVHLTGNEVFDAVAAGQATGSGNGALRLYRIDGLTANDNRSFRSRGRALSLVGDVHNFRLRDNYAEDWNGVAYYLGAGGIENGIVDGNTGRYTGDVAYTPTAVVQASATAGNSVNVVETNTTAIGSVPRYPASTAAHFGFKPEFASVAPTVNTTGWVVGDTLKIAPEARTAGGPLNWICASTAPTWVNGAFQPLRMTQAYAVFSVLAGATETFTVDVTGQGFVVQDVVEVTSTTDTGSTIVSAKSSTTTLTIRVYNPTGSTINVAAGTWVLNITRKRTVA